MWLYDGKELDAAPEQFQGFVYLITELDTGKHYVGKKNFWKPKTLPINKKRKRRVRTRTESDWREYYGSSKEFSLLVEQKGPSNFKREIIRLCKTKGEMSYYEAKYQFEHDVLFKDEYYNEFIGCKIHARHVRNSVCEDM